MKKKMILNALSEIIDFFKKRDGDDFSGDIYFSEKKMNSGSCKAIDYAADFLGLSRIQTVLFAVAVHQSSCRRNDMDDLSRFMNINYLDMLCYTDEWQALANKWLIRLINNDTVFVPREIINALTANKKYECPSTVGLNTMQIMNRFRRLLSSRDGNEITSELMLAQMDALVRDNPETSFSRACIKYNILDNFGENERIVFYALCYRYNICDDDRVLWCDLDDYFEEDDLDRLKALYYSERMMLQRRHIIEYCMDDGLVTKDCFHIVDDVKADLFEDAGGLHKQKSEDITLLDPDAMPEKEMVYDEDVEKEVGTLGKLLEDKRFAEVCNALKNKGLRTGFTCLFYGAPGTGKTETVYQLAKATGRKLLVADVSKLKNMFVGESEKKVKALFDDYRRYVKNNDRAPILLFNEADAVFGVRMEGAQRAVDKMENSIQNIILQEMESLNGIMIATTNLTSNLDKAFERRFLYKVRFNKPSVEARKKIWHLMLKDLSSEQSEDLAREFDFSGGQIENISRKKLIRAVIDGKEPDFEMVRDFCKQEIIADEATAGTAKVGF